MLSEDAIYRSLVDDDLTALGAVQCLVAIGYLREDAEDLVDEWVDELEASALIDDKCGG